MSVTKKLHYRLSISFLLFSMVFSSLAPTMSLAREVENSEPVSSRELTTEPTEILALPMPEEVKPAPLVAEEPEQIAPIESDLPELEIPVETLDVNTEEPEPYIQRDEIKSLTDKLNIEADSNSGAFAYGYPIEVPAGRNGLQPDLQLTYNSQNNDNQNLFGYGWAINIPYIERLNKKGVDKLYTEPYFNSSLTGELVAIDTNGNYASKVENGEFFDYQYDDVNNIWTARDKQGNVYTFGTTVASRQDNPNDTTKIFKWLLEEIRDTNDNFIRYEYYKDSGQIYPYKVFYTGSGSTDGIYEVEFLRESRSDNLKSFATGFNVSNNYRIYEIDIKIDNQWENKYHLNYVVGDNNTRSLLDNIVEGARDPNSGVMMAMPEDSFSYNSSSVNQWTEYEVTNIPTFLREYSDFNAYHLADNGVRFGDVNGDGLQDMVHANATRRDAATTFEKMVYINNGDNTWTSSGNYNIPVVFSRLSCDVYCLSPSYSDEGARLVEINGDGFVDIIESKINVGGIYEKHVYINNGDGTGWTEDINYIIPFVFEKMIGDDYGRSSLDEGARLVEINGDGLVDVIQSLRHYFNDFSGEHIDNQHVYINNGDGTGWTEDINYIIPTFNVYQIGDSNGYRLDSGVRYGDVNGDGLIDMVEGRYTRIAYVPPYNIWNTNKVYINNGDGTGWTEYVNYNHDQEFVELIWLAGTGYGPLNIDRSVRLFDYNNDGLDDFVYSYYHEVNDIPTYQASLSKNKGNGEWGTEYSIELPYHFTHTYYNKPSQNSATDMIDVNGDGLIDAIKSFPNNSEEDKHLYISNIKEEKIYTINSKDGAQINIDYQSSAQATSTSGLLNSELPFVVQTVKQITIDDGLGNESTIDYKYSDGQYYYNNPYDKKFAGFGHVEKIINDTKSITYYHQGNESNSSQGEHNDSYYKIGKPYRQEVYDNNTDYLLNQTIYKWEETDLGYDNSFIYNTLKSTTDFTNSTKSTAIQYQYSTSTGNLLVENNLGEVVLNTGTGEVTNQLIGDEKDTDYDYAQNTVEHILSAPKTKIISDSTDSKQQDLYYDNLPLGQIDKVNLTKEDYIEQDVEVNRKFNSYGLVYEQSDPNFATTTIVYDSNNLYPISSTDPLNNITYTDYNLLNGQIATSTAPNGAMTVNSFDAFGRLIATKISDPDNVNNLVVKQEISYQDTTLPRYKESKNYFDTNSYTTSREYYDGLDRVIQTKMQTAVANEYATVDISYDSQGRMNRQSLPYITSSISYSAPNLSQPAKTYTYDALGRVLTETTPVGTTSYEYNGFTTKITDANNNFKELTKDAYGNLVEVKEYNGNEIYTTTYQYTLTNKLKKITDSAGNIRNFSYDALDNLEWQDMVHKPSVTTPAKINYSHDKNGNVLTETSFKGDNISYVYDDLNRVLFEKLAGANQITYTYDQNNDIGQLSLADYGDNNRKAYDYDILGNLKTSTTTIEGEDFVMNFDYDLNGNVKSIVYPNNWLVSYGFNNIGQVNSVSLDKGTGPIVLTDNIEYNQNGQMTHLERSNGVVTDYTYDPLANFRLINLASTVATSTLQNISYAYDAVGNITQITDNSSTNLAKTAWYDYDDLYRLASSTVNYLTHPADNYSKTYDYDAIGNMTYNSDLGIMNYANGQPHQLSSFAGRTFTYDAAGNTKANNINKFSWDWRNRLKSSYDIASENSTYYKYDHNNQRFIKYTEELVFIPPDPQESMAMQSLTSEKNLDGVAGGTYELQRVKENKYIDSYFEKDIADNSKSHINLNSTKIATVNNNDNPYFILGDHLGSSSLLTDSTGTVAEMTDYLPYGKINYESTTQDLGDDYKHTGKELDEENALQYFGARYMDNEVGRFTSVDPLLSDLQNSEKYNKKVVELLSDPQQVNSYSYTRNNPIVYTDPTGNAVETPFDLVMLALSAQAYYSNPTAGNVVWLGLDVLGTLAPGVPAASYFRFSHKAHQIIKYFDEVAEIANKKTVDIISTFVKNVAFKFNRRAWSIGEAGNDVASLTGHFAKWGDSVGAKNVGDYYNKANDFIESKQYTQAFKEGRDTVYYNRNNKYVAITGSKGEIKSYHLETNPNKLSNYEARIKKGNYE